MASSATTEEMKNVATLDLEGAISCPALAGPRSYAVLRARVLPFPWRRMARPKRATRAVTRSG